VLLRVVGGRLLAAGKATSLFYVRSETKRLNEHRSLGNPMTSSFNPYANSSVLLTPIPPASQWSSIAVTLVGLLLGSLATIGAMYRLWLVIQDEPGHWQTVGSQITEGAPLVGLATFAVTACILLMMLVSAASFKAGDLRICQGFIVLATVAMLMRTISEPNEAWTPHWPAYGLTISAAIAMGMVLRRFRSELRKNDHHTLLRQTLSHEFA